MIIPVYDLPTTKNEYWTDTLKKCQEILYRHELDNAIIHSDPVILVLYPEVVVPNEVNDFSLFDAHTFENGFSFKNYHVAISMLEVLATPKIRSDLCQAINRRRNLFNDIAEHFYITKQLFLSCGFVVNIDGKIS